MIRISILFLFSLLAFSGIKAQQQQLLTNDGAWCWFSDPRAIYTNTKKAMIITGWIDKSGNVYAASLDPGSGKIATKKLYPELEIDDHDNPAFLELADGNILSQYTWHNGTVNGMGVIQNTTDQPFDVAHFGSPVVFKPYSEALVKKYQKQTYSYANPFMLKAEQNKLYSFGRWIGFKPNLITSTDNGKTWSEPKVVITSQELDINNRPYVKYHSDGRSKIHLLFTDGHPNNEPLNSVYYCYYENNAFWRADGTKICAMDELPFHPEDASVVYKATPETGKAWIFDIAIDKKGRPVVVYTRYPTNREHLYYYAVYNKGKWEDNQLINSGTWFPEDEVGKKQREENYSGGMTLDPQDPSTVYFSHQVNGVFELSKATTGNFGRSWKITPVTRNSKLNNVRPVIPRYKKKSDPTVLLWMQCRKYLHYTNYDADIVYRVLK
ncbi:MAG: BNR-4 repeat-containing protein [Chitinophagaceae bacterium]|nr:BNR-4 repeat-containing protein [Chitinophagaceae bacterium]